MNRQIPNSIHSAHLSAFIDAALSAADPIACVKTAISFSKGKIRCGSKTYTISKKNRVWIFGLGKAAHAMGQGAVEVMGDLPWSGGMVVKHLPENPLACPYWLANHPLPGDGSIDATRRLLDLCRQVQPDDLAIVLISGGGSALLTSPNPGITLMDLQETTQHLLMCGADIHEINTIRKHLDSVKGGGLLRRLQGQVFSLILSDVIGNTVGVIASGPLSADQSSFGDAYEIFEKYGLTTKVPPRVLQYVRVGIAGIVPETLKAGDPSLNRVEQIVIGSNQHSLEQVEQTAGRLGWRTQVYSRGFVGEARERGREFAEKMKALLTAHRQGVQPPTLLLAGGETTVTLNGHGTGGRNQELALAAVRQIDGLDQVTLATLATDGEDGPTDAAGALVTAGTMTTANQMGLDPDIYLTNNDAYSFFSAVGGLICTGPTGTNVNDLTFGLIGLPDKGF